MSTRSILGLSVAAIVLLAAAGAAYVRFDGRPPDGGPATQTTGNQDALVVVTELQPIKTQGRSHVRVAMAAPIGFISW